MLSISILPEIVTKRDWTCSKRESVAEIPFIIGKETLLLGADCFDAVVSKMTCTDYYPT